MTDDPQFSNLLLGYMDAHTLILVAALQLYAEMSAETGAVLAARREIRKANRAEMIKSVDGMIKRAAKKSVKARKS